MMFVTCCLVTYCYCCSTRSRRKTIITKKKSQRHRLQLPL